MLNQTKTMEPFSATDVEQVGSTTLLDSLAAEVEAAANQLGSEIIFLLIEKWELDIAKAEEEGRLSVQELLHHYVRLKISLHHVRRHYERYDDWPCSQTASVHYQRLINLKDKAKEARRKYYVAKQRYEGEHRTGCDCRGCRCIGKFWG